MTNAVPRRYRHLASALRPQRSRTCDDSASNSIPASLWPYAGNLSTEHRRILECLDRPESARGGYGQSVATTQRRVQFIERTSVILAESPASYQAWRQLLTAYNIEGVAVHDARLVALMQTSGINHILSLNARDFARYPFVTAVIPQDVVGATPPA